METSNSGATHAVLHAQNDRWGLEPMETSYSGDNQAVLHAQKDRWGLGPMETSNSGANHAVCMHKPTGEVWDQYRLLILVVISLFWMHKTTDEGWDP